MQSDRTLHYLDLIDWWEASRWTAKARCEQESQDLKSYAAQAADDLSTSQLMQTNSSDRALIEAHIATRIQACEEALVNSITSFLMDFDLGNPTQLATAYQGWSYWDLGRVLIGGSAPAAAAILGTRAAATAIAAIGATVVAAPVTITVGLAGMVWGAYSTAEAKRTDYKKALCTMIDQVLLSLDGPESSVLSRQFFRLDRIIQQQGASN